MTVRSLYWNGKAKVRLDFSSYIPLGVDINLIIRMVLTRLKELIKTLVWLILIQNLI